MKTRAYRYIKISEAKVYRCLISFIKVSIEGEENETKTAVSNQTPSKNQ